MFLNLHRSFSWPLAACLAGVLSACGGGGGAAVETREQRLSWTATPAAMDLNGSTSISAQATSGLPVNYSVDTPQVCRVDALTGQITALALGTCEVKASQSGNSRFAPADPVRLRISVTVNPNQTLVFGAAPTLVLGGVATVQATASSALPVSYASATPGVCSVDSGSGLVTALSLGTCSITAQQAGNATYLPAPQAQQDLAVALPSGMGVPQAPTGVSATFGSSASSVIITATGVDAGGSPIVQYSAVSEPAGLSAQSATLPVTVNCGGSCAGRFWRLRATNALGDGADSAATAVVARYAVLLRFFEPDTQPNDTLFTGTFQYNASTRTVSQLQGQLTESMTGSSSGVAPYYDMIQVTLSHQLSSVSDGQQLLVTTFRNPSTATFTTLGGGDGWSPEWGVQVGGLYHGYPTGNTGIANPGNAYARITVNTDDPTAPPSAAQLARTAYADCVPTAAGGMANGGGMMGATCMTGTSLEAHGAVGTMSGTPASQSITRLP